MMRLIAVLRISIFITLDARFSPTYAPTQNTQATRVDVHPYQNVTVVEAKERAKARTKGRRAHKSPVEEARIWLSSL